MINILIVDDEFFARYLTKETLKRNFNNVNLYEAESGELALKILNQEEMDILILDSCLGDMSGEEICQIIRNEIKNDKIKIILATGLYYNENHKLLVLVDEYLMKPYNDNMLVNIINNFTKEGEI